MQVDWDTKCRIMRLRETARSLKKKNQKNYRMVLSLSMIYYHLFIGFNDFICHWIQLWNTEIKKGKRFKKIAWIWSHHLQWKFKLWAGNFAWGVKTNIAGHCHQTFYFQKFVVHTQQCVAFTPQANFPSHNLNFQWRWRWWDRT